MLDFHGIQFIGFTAETGWRVLLTSGVVGLVLAARVAVVALARVSARAHPNERLIFWIRQGSSLAAFGLVLLATISIWFDNAARLATVAGFATAGLAIAAQRAVTAFAGYLVIMRGRTFTVGDRIKMAGVRGDVIALGFLQTRILEMGQPPDVNEQEEPGMWVRARQFSGRIVTVTNDKVFDDAVYNFTREFPFIWEEISIPVPYRADWQRAEQIMLSAAREFTAGNAEASAPARSHFESQYNVRLDEATPRAYLRLTDNWIELTVRFLVPEHGVREIKNAISRRILTDFDAAHIEIASATMEIAGVPVVRIARERPHMDRHHSDHCDDR